MADKANHSGPLDDAMKMAEGVAGVFSALRALCVEDPEVESLCQVGATLTQNLSNELETVPRVRRVPVIGTIGDEPTPEVAAAPDEGRAAGD